MGQLNPNDLMFNDPHVLEMFHDDPDLRVEIAKAFSDVMRNSGLDRDEPVRGYNRTTREAVTLDPTSVFQRNQAEHASDVTALFESKGLTARPFSVDMSAALMVPNSVPDSLRNGDDGTATV